MRSLWFWVALGFAFPALPASSHHYLIPAQRLDTALAAWRDVSGLSFGMDAGLKLPLSSAVEGDFEPEQALCLLLRGTGFTFVDSSRYHWIVPEADADPARGVHVLAENCSRFKGKSGGW